MRYYSNTAVATTLENPGGITPTTTQLILQNTTGYPNTFPFTLRLDPDLPTEELVTVTSGSGSQGNPYVIQRGQDGTSAKSHAQYSVVTHGFSARDLREPQEHIADNTRHLQRPLVSGQLQEPSYNQTGVYVNFTSAQWPAISFTMPPSGWFEVHISAAIWNVTTTTSTAWSTYRISGGLVRDPGEGVGISSSGLGRVYAGRSFIFGGGQPGVTTVVTPVWNISSGSGATAFIGFGQIHVKFYP